MANISTEGEFTVSFESENDHLVALEELKDFITYLETFPAPDSTILRFVSGSDGKLHLSVDLPVSLLPHAPTT